ncbi:rod shape determining protein RodA [Marininema mesophilum]|uniref:Rod shape determining protein RodA n=1 Tax=Marininema mesophilum TaxID=1048340 RepID=A0A1H2R096_9BACL|nr:rod shape-determining protein RodA [Marininema mesophilum]SDW12608.1 rod shape determining protein RodA [Marininema mesophilum]
MKISRMIRQLDFLMIMLILMLAGVSMIAISGATYSTNPIFFEKQISWYITSILLMIATLLFDYRLLAHGRFVYVLYGVGLFLLLLVMIPGIGVTVKGVQQWIRVGGFQFQPSEFMKVILIILVAKFLAEVRTTPVYARDVWKMLLLFAVPFLIILKQPDLGTSLVLVGILGSILLVGGLYWRTVITVLAIVGVLVASVFVLYLTNSPLLHVILAEHQIQRISTFVNPALDPSGTGYQLTQSMIAVGSGELMGKGFHHGTQAQGRWIPEPHNDFIFAVFAEEWGFLGGAILLCLFIFLVYRMMRVAVHCEDRFGTLIVTGVVGMVVFQVFQNIGMSVGMLPVTGLPLPYISYGGSSLLTQLVAAGLVLNVSMRRGTDLLFTD